MRSAIILAAIYISHTAEEEDVKFMVVAFIVALAWDVAEFAILLRK